MEHIIRIDVKDKIATKTGDTEYVCGNSDYEVHFTFDEEWNEYPVKTARFIPEKQPPIDVVFEGDVCPVPKMADTYKIRVGVYAGDQSTTTPAYIPARKSILCGSGSPSAPPEDVYAQIMKKVNDAVKTADDVQNRANAGEFDGKDGKDGLPGKDGYTPQKGVDYFDGKDGADGKDATVDTTLSIAGQAADAKATSEALSMLKDHTADLQHGVLKPAEKDDFFFSIGGINSNGTISYVATFVRNGFNFVKAGSVVSVKDGFAFNIATYRYPVATEMITYRGVSSEPYAVTEDCYIMLGIRDDAGTTWTVDNMSVAADALNVSAINVGYKTTMWSEYAIRPTSGYITTNGAAGSVLSYQVGANAAFAHYVIDCEAGDTFVATGIGGSSPRFWCFVDENDVILANDKAGGAGKNLILCAKKKGKLVINSDINSTEYPLSLLIPADVGIVIDDLKNRVSALEPGTEKGRYLFGQGISCKFDTPMLDALTVPTDRLSYFYALYDNLLETYPNYISKVDCDSEVAAAGIVRPEETAGYPTYLYKFRPPHTPKSSGFSDTETSATVLKVFVTTGTHPEYISIYDMYQTMREICENWRGDENLEALRWDCEFYVMPCSVPYCVQNNTRTNYNGVDLNRNMATSDWMLNGVGTNTYSGESAGSEYESKVLAYYIDQIKPFMYVDHHNTNAGDGKNLIYIDTPSQEGVDIGASHISMMTRRWKARFPETFPDDDTIYGFVMNSRILKGTRATYGQEHGAYSFTFESNESLRYKAGVYSESSFETNTGMCVTLATDGFVNFLLYALGVLTN